MVSRTPLWLSTGLGASTQRGLGPTFLAGSESRDHTIHAVSKAASLHSSDADVNIKKTIGLLTEPAALHSLITTIDGPHCGEADAINTGRL